jgi:hypothetical protein
MSYEHHKQCVNDKVSREYRAYRNMLSRCRNPKHPAWKWYGARNIRVCFSSFAEFLAAVGGPCPKGWCLDRTDYDRGYEQGNIRWVKRKTSSRNRRPRVDKYGVRTVWVRELAKRMNKLMPAELMWLAEFLMKKWYGVTYDDIQQWMEQEKKTDDTAPVQIPKA